MLGERWERVGDFVGLFQAVVIVAIVAIAGYVVWRHLIRPRLAAAGDLPPPETMTTEG